MKSYFPPILLALQMPVYNLTKFRKQLLKSLTVSDYTRKESFSFTEEVAEFQNSFFITRFDVKSPFTNNISNKNAKSLLEKSLEIICMLTT